MGFLSVKFIKFLSKPYFAFLIAAVMEVFHLSVVLVMVKPFSTALEIVKQINEELTANSRQLMLKEKAPKGNNLRDSQDFVSASEQATKESLQGKEDKTINSQLLHDYPGHLTVSLEDGIIRPIPGINAPQRIVLACITAHPGYSVPQISASTGIPAKSIERHVAALIDKNLIEHRGSKKTGGYYPL